MAARRIDPRAAKLSRTYDVRELAALLRVHKNTVRHWQRDGLKPLDSARPVLFHGSSVREYLGKRKASRRAPCPPGTIYCFKCRAPRQPAGGMVDFIPFNATGGNIRALCLTCETVMHRRARAAALDAIMPGCEVQFGQAQPRLEGKPRPSLN